MRLSSIVVSGVFLAGAACASPTSPSLVLDGTWSCAACDNPGGGGISFTLATSGDSVIGTGLVCGPGPWCSPGPVTITGQRVSEAGNVLFLLTLTDSAFVATYQGQFLGPNEIQGTWTQGRDSTTLAFGR